MDGSSDPRVSQRFAGDGRPQNPAAVAQEPEPLSAGTDGIPPMLGLWWISSIVCAVAGLILLLRLRVASRHPLAKRPDNSSDRLEHAP